MKRATIVGTAASWTQAPWKDPGTTIVSLNDAYLLGVPRADEWYELHPIDKFFFRPKDKKVIDAATIPPGHYLRPEGHLEKLQEMAKTIPVWLQSDPPAGWPVNAQRLPIEELEATFGQYWASGPAYILMHLFARGFREIGIYGIHLATQQEYIDQRPNFEALIGSLLGPSKQVERKDGLRIYRGDPCTIILPESSPIFQHGWKYGYEPRPVPPPNPYRDELGVLKKQKDHLIKSLVNLPTGADKAQLYERLRRVEIAELDCNQQLAKAAHRGGTLVATLGG
jgi:hypothetical protein